MPMETRSCPKGGLAGAGAGFFPPLTPPNRGNSAAPSGSLTVAGLRAILLFYLFQLVVSMIIFVMFRKSYTLTVLFLLNSKTNIPNKSFVSREMILYLLKIILIHLYRHFHKQTLMP